MCKTTCSLSSTTEKKPPSSPSSSASLASTNTSTSTSTMRLRRSKRDKQETVSVALAERRKHGFPSSSVQVKTTAAAQNPPKRKPSRKSKSLKRHESDGPSGGMSALLPSVIGVAILFCGAMAKMGFRGRATVAGIDLGTTNSVICVQAQSKSVGEIECIPDPSNGSPIIPSVVSFLDPHDEHHSKSRGGGSTSRKNNKGRDGPNLFPDPSHVVVGHEAKLRIDTHPHHTLYHAKRVLGRPFEHDAVRQLTEEVEFDVIPDSGKDDANILFRVPFHTSSLTSHDDGETTHSISIQPQQVGSYVVNHLMDLTRTYLGHDNVKSAVIAVPAKFDPIQRSATVEAFRSAGISVARVLEEPTAAALAYGLDKKDGVEHILVYDFGGGTLDVSILRVSEDGYVDVLGSDGDDRLGGADFDAAIAHFLLEGADEKKKGKKEVVKHVSIALKHLEEQLRKEILGGTTDGQDHDDFDFDFEETLAASCPELESLHLCTLSSFHTMAEKMKITLSSYPEGGGMAREKCLALPEGKDFSSLTIEEFCSALQPLELTLTSSELNEAVPTLYERSILPIRRILADLNLRRDEIDEVVMVGGTTRMPQIRVMVREELGVSSLNTHIDPDLTVAYGAASVID